MSTLPSAPPGTVRRATVIEVTPALLTKDKLGNPVSLAGYRRVRDETGAVHTLINGAVNGTSAERGTSGRVVRVQTPTMNLWTFVPDTEEE